MPVASYSVTLSTPISVYPSGLQGVLTVRNSDVANTVYLSDVANGNGYPLGPGSAISWDARKPLYAYVVAGFPATVYVIDNGGGLFDAAAVAAQISASQLAAQIGAVMPTTIKQVYGAVLFGNGSDGAVTVAGTVTLTRDMNYTTLLVPTGAVLKTAGFKVFATVSITTEGTGKIHNEGANCPGGASAPGGAGGLTGSLLGGGAGANVGGTGTAPANANFNGGSGGQGVGVNAPGVVPVNPYTLFNLDTTGLITHTMSGGGGGGSAPSGSSGGGGGGGVVFLSSPLIANGGVISVNGGGSSPGSNGGGGGGGVVILLYTTKTGNAPTVLGGAGIGTGLAGARGVETELAV